MEGGRDDDPQASGYGHQTGAPGLVIPQLRQKGYAHSSYRSSGSRAGTGNGPIEQTSQDHCTGKSSRDPSGKKGEEIEQFPGNPALSHDHTPQDEQGYRQDGGGIGSGKSIVQHLAHGATLVEQGNRSRGSQDHADPDGQG